MNEELIPCPFCAEPIRAAAKKCRYCGEFLIAGLTQEKILAEHAQRLAAAPPAENKTTPAVSTEATPEPVAAASTPTEIPAVVVTADSGETSTQATSALAQLYERLAGMPDSQEKEKVQQALQLLEEQAGKGDEADESAVESTLKNMAMLLPDVAEITINTIINPVSGVTTLIQKVAQRVAESQKQKSETAPETATPDASTPAEISQEKVTELLTDLQEQLPDSVEKEMVQEVLAQVGDGNAAAAATNTQAIVATATEVVATVVDLADGKPDSNQGNGIVASLVEVATAVITNNDNKS